MTHATDPRRTRDRLDSTRLHSRRLARRRSMRSIDRSIDDSIRGFFAPFDAEADGWMLTRSVIRITRVRRGRRERSSKIEEEYGCDSRARFRFRNRNA